MGGGISDGCFRGIGSHANAVAANTRASIKAGLAVRDPREPVFAQMQA
jgi:hypothetical protein